MGVQRGDWEGIRRGNVWRPDNLNAGVPSIDAGAGLRALAEAKRAEGKEKEAFWNGIAGLIQPLTQGVIAYAGVKAMQKEKMNDAKAALDDYKNKVNSGQIEYDPSEYGKLATALDGAKKTYDGWFNLSPQASDKNPVDFRNDVMQWGTDVSKRSFMQSLMRQDAAASAAQSAIGEAKLGD